jgi:hypothetical protein
MKIHAHAESHVVELDDGSQWQIFPGDLATTLSWKPETDLHLEPSGDQVKFACAGEWHRPKPRAGDCGGRELARRRG